MKNNSTLCQELFNITNKAKEDYLNNLKSKLQNSYKKKIILCLEEYAKNGFYDTKIILYLCPEGKKCSGTEIIHSAEINKIKYNLEELRQFKIYGKNLFDDSIKIFKSILIEDGFRIGIDLVKKSSLLTEKFCGSCQSLAEIQIEIHIYWDVTAANKIENKVENRLENKLEPVNYLDINRLNNLSSSSNSNGSIMNKTSLSFKDFNGTIPKCKICNKNLIDSYLSNCKHCLCKNCIDNYKNKINDKKCPICFKKYNKNKRLVFVPNN